MGDDGARQLTVRPFRRRLGRYTAVFEAAEASLIADLVDGHHAHVVQPPGLLVRVTFSQDDADT